MAGSHQSAPKRRPARARRRGGRRTVALTGLLLVVLTLAACGDPSGGPAGAPTPSAVPLDSLLLDPSALPAGFRPSSGQSTGYRFTLCGVDLEPTPAVEQVSARFARSEIGPFVEQRVRRYPDDSQRDVIEAMRTALATCTTTQATEPGGTHGTALTVSRLELPTFAEQSVAWHQVSTSSPQVPTDVVLMRRDRTIVLVTSYTFERTTDPGTVLAAARAAAQRLTSGGSPAGSAS
jgi:hypothetical protein